MDAIERMEWSALKTMAMEDGWGILGDKIAIYKKASNELFLGQLLKVVNPSIDASSETTGAKPSGEQGEVKKCSFCNGTGQTMIQGLPTTEPCRNCKGNGVVASDTEEVT